jgi:hypothetical protein
MSADVIIEGGEESVEVCSSNPPSSAVALTACKKVSRSSIAAFKD